MYWLQHTPLPTCKLKNVRAKKNNNSWHLLVIVVYMRFPPITILAGDILLAEGLRKLSEAANELPKEQSNMIMRLTSEAVFEICSAEAFENQLHDEFTIPPQDYQKVLELKSVVPDLAMKIGAIVGNGSPREVKELGAFGRTYGVIAANIEEFADLLEIDELQNRLENECPPLPLLYAMENSVLEKELCEFLKVKPISENIHNQIVDIVLASKEVSYLQKCLIENAELTLKKLPDVNEKIREELECMLLVQLECLK